MQSELSQDHTLCVILKLMLFGRGLVSEGLCSSFLGFTLVLLVMAFPIAHQAGP